MNRSGEYQHAWPEFLPDGRRFPVHHSKYSRRSRPGSTSRRSTAIRRALSCPPFPASGTSTDTCCSFGRECLSPSHSMPPRRRSLARRRRFADRVKYHPDSDAAFDVSKHRRSRLRTRRRRAHDTIDAVRPAGRELERYTPPGYYRHPRFSPDGHRVAAERIDPTDRNVDLWLFDIVRGTVSRLTSNPAPTSDPRGLLMAVDCLLSKRREVYDVYAKSVDTTEAEQPLVAGPGDKFVEHLVGRRSILSGAVLRSGLWITPFNSSTKPWLVRADEKVNSWQSEFSPDEKWLAYTSRESGNAEVYVEPFPATGARWQVSSHGGAEPHWREMAGAPVSGRRRHADVGGGYRGRMGEVHAHPPLSYSRCRISWAATTTPSLPTGSRSS